MAAPAGAALREWPGAAPCNGTLQACVDASASGDTVVVASEATISGGVAIGSKSLVLRAAPGLRPALAAGTSITASGSAAGSVSVTVEGFALRDGRIALHYSGPGTARFTVRDNVLEASSRNARAGIELRNGGSGTTTVQVENNRITTGTPSLNDAALLVTAAVGSVQGQVLHNHVTGLPADTSGWGILLDAISGATMEVAIAFNEVRGHFQRSGIGMSEGLFSSTPSQLTAHVYSNVVVCSGQFANGIGSTLASGDIDVDVVSNTIVSCNSGLTYSRWGGSTPGGTIEGMARSNIIAYNQRGLFLNPEFFAGITESDNLFWQNPFNQPAPHGSAIHADPLFLSPQQPFLRDGSPAIDAGYTWSTLLQSLAGLPALDASGLRRLRGNRVDMGAYEHGDTTLKHTATPGNTSTHVTRIEGAPFGGDASAVLFTTPSYDGGTGPDGPTYSRPFGVYLTAGSWRIFSQDFGAIPTGARFNVFAPRPGNGVFSHVTSSTSVSGWSSRIDHPMLNDRPEKFLLATQNWTSGGSGTYNPHPIGVFHFGFGGPGAWYVTNLDQPAGVDMPEDIGFNLYVQDRSPNAFLAEATPANTVGQALLLAHPLLDGTPCAQPQVTRIFDGAAVSGHYDVEYQDSRQRWGIFNHDAAMPAGSRFFVLVDPRQVAECRGDLFRDGFE